MYAMVLVLNDVDKLNTILTVLFDLGLGATVFDSVGLGRVLIENGADIPIFSSIRKMVEGSSRPYNKTILSVVRESDTLNKAISLIEKELGYFKEPGQGFLFVLPVTTCYGFGISS